MGIINLSPFQGSITCWLLTGGGTPVCVLLPFQGNSCLMAFVNSQFTIHWSQVTIHRSLINC